MNRRTQRQYLAALAFTGLCGILGTAFVARSQQPASTAPAQQSPTQKATQEANETFQARCSTCHAEHGEGSEVGATLNVPDLRSADVQKLDDAQLRLVIKTGRRNMPSFGRDFSDGEIDQILRLIRTFAAASTTQAQ